jgi:hypothetical protein
MATNEQMRRASGSAMEQSRRQSGRDMEQSRRSGGARMEAERRGADVVSDLQALQGPARQQRTLPPLGAVGGKPAQRGRATYQPPAGQGGGIASPLTEPDAAQREYYDSTLVPTSDGLMWMRVRPTKKIVMQDGNGAELVMEFQNDVSQYTT